MALRSAEVNLNDYIFVELSSIGERILHEYLEAEDNTVGRLSSDKPWYRTPDQRFSEWTRDERGRYRFQMYQLMAIFGPHTPDCATSVGLPFESMNVTITST